jgi:hypothetical protein
MKDIIQDEMAVACFEVLPAGNDHEHPDAECLQETVIRKGKDTDISSKMFLYTTSIMID